MQSQSNSSLSGSSNREALLEKELDEVYEKIDAMKKAKRNLEQSVLELQNRLTAAEVKSSSAAPVLSELVAVEAAMKQGERERILESQVLTFILS
jgi:predicted  nucleic acid-binding Zn-ribbon protein